MKSLSLNPCDVTPNEARRIQVKLHSRREREDRLPPLGRVAGVDVALDLARGRGIAGVLVYRFPDLVELERPWPGVKPIYVSQGRRVSLGRAVERASGARKVRGARR